MRQTFFIGTTLPALNEMIGAAASRVGRYSPYNEKKILYESLIKDDVRKAKIKPIRAPVRLHCLWQEKNQKRDKDNIACGVKYILDSLVAMHILTNDGWNQILGITHEWIVDAKRPGVTVTMETV